MANDGKIYITISDTRGGKGAGVSNDSDKKSDKKENTALKFARHKFFNFVENEARTIANYSISNIGNFTGDYMAQYEIQASIEMISFAVDLGMAAATGAKIGGGIGAAVAVGVELTAKGISKALSINSEIFEYKKINRNIDIMRERLGLEGLTNGGRTGGY